MLVIFSGLPAVGKTTIAARVASMLSGLHLRIDSLEMALVRSGLVKSQDDLGSAGYEAAYAVARDNLKIGLSVVADSVNPIKITRDAWRDVALKLGVPYLEVEVICPDTVEHRKRVEHRVSDIDGLRLPRWRQVQDREYELWDRANFIVDTSILGIDEAVDTLLKEIKTR